MHAVLRQLNVMALNALEFSLLNDNVNIKDCNTYTSHVILVSTT